MPQDITNITIGFFNLVNEADVFVYLDDVQWTKSDWRNRNRVRTPQGWTWLTVPVITHKHHKEYLIKDVQIDYSQDWQSKHLKTLEMCYKHSPYFEEVFPCVEAILNFKIELIARLNETIVNTFCSYMELPQPDFRFSEYMTLPESRQKNDRLLAILEYIGSIDHYLSGPSAKGYLDENRFEATGIKIEWHNYKHPYYNQKIWKSTPNTFISHLSILDLLFNHGKESKNIITGRIKIDKPDNIVIRKAGEDDDK
jgi:hypothetical protein